MILVLKLFSPLTIQWKQDNPLIQDHSHLLVRHWQVTMEWTQQDHRHLPLATRSIQWLAWHLGVPDEVKKKQLRWMHSEWIPLNITCIPTWSLKCFWQAASCTGAVALEFQQLHTWPEVSSKISAFSFVTSFMVINYQDYFLPEAVSKGYLKISMLYWTGLQCN